MNMLFDKNNRKPVFDSIIVNMAANSIDKIKNIFEKILKFDVIYDDSYNLVFHSPKFSNQLFLHFTKGVKTQAILTKEHLIVFYLNNYRLYLNLCNELINNGAEKETAFNPYWNEKGSSFVVDKDIHIILCPDSYQHYKSRIAAPGLELGKIVGLLQKCGLKKIDEFINHKKFDGVMLGSDLIFDTHLEFTHYRGNCNFPLTNHYSITLLSLNSDKVNTICFENGDVIIEAVGKNSEKWHQVCTDRLLTKK